MPKGTRINYRMTTKQRRDLNTLLYNTETQELRIRVSLARFNNSKRVRGASLGKAPKTEDVGKVPANGRGIIITALMRGAFCVRVRGFHSWVGALTLSLF